MVLEDFIKKIRFEEEPQRCWHIIQTCFKKGNIIYYSENINERLGAIEPEIDYTKKNPYLKEMYNFLRDNESDIQILLEIQGLALEKFTHGLGGSVDYRYVYYVKKIESISENKYITQTGVSPYHGFIMGVIAVSTNLGRSFISRTNFEKQFMQEPEKLCHRNVDRLKLYAIFQINVDAVDAVFDKKLLNKVQATINKLIRDGYIQEVISKTGESYISLAPGGFLWEKLTSPASSDSEV